MWGGSTREEASEMAKECSAMQLISADAPPISMSYGMTPDAKRPSENGRLRGWLIHRVVFGTKLKEKADQLGFEADLRYPGADSQYSLEVAFFATSCAEQMKEKPWATVHSATNARIQV